MLKDLKVKVGPNYYRYHKGAIDVIPDILNDYMCKNILIVHGSISWRKAIPKMNFLKQLNQKIYYHKYTGECSYYGADLIKNLVDKYNIDFIIGVGGGKLADLVGYAANISNVNFGLIPTIVSNCAAWTPLSVMYKENGMSEGVTEHYTRQAVFLITDPYLVIDSPIKFFKAGIADTIAKWYESEAILAQQKLINEPFLKLASFTCRLCNDVIMNESEKAINDMQQKLVTDEFVHVSEIIIAIAGLCGGLGDKYARNAIAHAMHDAMSKYVSKCHKYLHGEKVAYGIFYQLAVEDKWSTIDKLMDLYLKLNLPKSLKDMGISLNELPIDEIVKFVNSKEKVHLLPIEINEDILKNSIIKLEQYIR